MYVWENVSRYLAFEGLCLLLLQRVDLTQPLLPELLNLFHLTRHHDRNLLQLRLRVAPALPPHTYIHSHIHTSHDSIVSEEVQREARSECEPDLSGLLRRTHFPEVAREGRHGLRVGQGDPLQRRDAALARGLERQTGATRFRIHTLLCMHVCMTMNMIYVCMYDRESKPAARRGF